MHCPNFRTSVTKLREALEGLERTWRDTHEFWADSSSDSFEKHHVAPIRPKVMTTLAATQRLADVMAHAQRECDRRNDS